MSLAPPLAEISPPAGAMPRPAEKAPPARAKGPSGYMPTLDGWRAVAIGLVILCHLAEGARHGLGGWKGGTIDFLWYYGSFGVQLFFAISGFLICSRLLEERRAKGRISLRSFYVRRAFRILPPMLALLCIAGVLSWLGVVWIPFKDWLAALLCFANYYRPIHWYFGHFWSLAVEEHFYLIWPSLLILAGTRRAGWWAVALALFVAAWRAINIKYFPAEAAATNFYGRTDIVADGLLWGCVFAFIYTSPRGWRILTEVLAPRIWSILVLLLVIAETDDMWMPLLTGSATHGSAESMLLPDWKVRQCFMLLTKILAPAVIVGTVLHAKSIAGRLLELAPIRWIGRLSYSLYLWQQFFLPRLDARSAHMGMLQTMPWNLLCALACAAGSYYLIEKPFIKLGHHMAKPATAGRSDVKQ